MLLYPCIASRNSLAAFLVVVIWGEDGEMDRNGYNKLDTEGSKGRRGRQRQGVKTEAAGLVDNYLVDNFLFRALVTT